MRKTSKVIKGKAESILPELGRAKSVRVAKKVESKSVLSIRKPKFSDNRSLSEIAAELRKQVPPEEWRKVPRDLSENIDKYLY